MSDAGWAVVRDAMPVPGWLEGRGGQPEAYCHRQMIDAVRYLNDNGCKWLAMPLDFPLWDRVYAFNRRWRIKGLLGELHDRLRGQVREDAGRDPQPTAGIADSQTVRASAHVPQASSGYDAGKRTPGRKRHLLVDCLGLLLGVVVTAASVQDRDAARPLLRHARARFHRLALVWADGAYTGRLVDWAAEKLHLELQIIKRSDDTSGFVVLPRRWVVERTNAWLMRTRRLARDYEGLPEVHEQMVVWSMTTPMTRRLARRRA
ncbi:IS5 family transposase [Streptacidiphilus sp. P02-A3a]|uniref:IS5 family transposase n=1 Tax=Streptacidiphilus sp. P02-A3a TaxID=2704468 RepID=UPI0015F842FB|nr:IS5 family transposase [Streptacidiphilus sp. P02-A3a]QMU69763.1 IS5 family transposase [Streptacidiphilus sp. P02-A3a]